MPTKVKPCFEGEPCIEEGSKLYQRFLKCWNSGSKSLYIGTNLNAVTRYVYRMISSEMSRNSSREISLDSFSEWVSTLIEGGIITNPDDMRLSGKYLQEDE